MRTNKSQRRDTLEIASKQMTTKSQLKALVKQTNGHDPETTASTKGHSLSQLETGNKS